MLPPQTQKSRKTNKNYRQLRNVENRRNGVSQGSGLALMKQFKMKIGNIIIMIGSKKI